MICFRYTLQQITLDFFLRPLFLANQESRKESIVVTDLRHANWTCPGLTDTRTLRMVDPQKKEV